MAHLPLIIPPFRFACVEPGVYRGCYPNRLNERFLLRLQLRTIISLAPNDPNSWLPDYCTQHQIARFSFPTDVPKENVTLQTESIQRCLELLLDPRRHPLYLHCTDGTANTSLIIIALRRLQLWPLTAAIAEYLRFSSTDEFPSEEEDFIAGLHVEVQVPPIVPYWLWGPAVADTTASDDCEGLASLLARENPDGIDESVRQLGKVLPLSTRVHKPYENHFLQSQPPSINGRPIQSWSDFHPNHFCTLCQELPFNQHPLWSLQWASRHLTDQSDPSSPPSTGRVDGSATTTHSSSATVTNGAAQSDTTASHHHGSFADAHRFPFKSIARSSSEVAHGGRGPALPDTSLKLSRSDRSTTAPLNKSSSDIRKDKSHKLSSGSASAKKLDIDYSMGKDPEEEGEEGQAEWVELSLAVRALALEAHGL